ncbi:hypothetical protein [Veillonella caviae]|nr:hypothetical protein [Veillonella caviae]MDY6224364.1 hypothetical protein [Veillonella caviae]
MTEVKNGTISLSDILRICAFLDMRADIEYNEQNKSKDKTGSGW